MVALVADERGLLLRFTSDITFVDYAVDIVDDLLSYRGLGERTNLLIVCRELLKNAVVHGNRNDPHKAVSLRVRSLAGGRYRVEVKDGGSGFDTASMAQVSATRLAEPGGPRGLPGSSGVSRASGWPTGLALIGAVADQVAFDEGGSRVTVFLDPAMDSEVRAPG
jgi:anti-sigma regulatory factor (Ser/Thr protein kinase)